MSAISLRRAGGWGAAFIAFNGMIGAGIFGLPGKLDAAVGGFAPWLLLIAGAGVMLIALCYADLASRFDANGGPQLYAATAFGPFVGFQSGWLVYASRSAATAANAVLLGSYAGALWPGIGGTALALAAILTVTALNLFDLKRVMALLGAMSLAKLLPLAALALAGVAALVGSAPGSLPPVPADWGAAEGVALAALYAFVGFEAVTFAAGETRDPRRAVPRALLGSVALVTLLYVLIQAAYSARALGASERPLADLATALWGPAGLVLIALTAMISVLANIASATTSAPRLTVALAEQQCLPARFAARSGSGAPYVSVLLYGGLALALALSGSFVFLAVVSSLARLLPYLACVAAVPLLDARDGRTRWLRGRMLPLAAGLLCLWAISQSAAKEWMLLGGFIVAGSLLYMLARRSLR